MESFYQEEIDEYLKTKEIIKLPPQFKPIFDDTLNDLTHYQISLDRLFITHLRVHELNLKDITLETFKDLITFMEKFTI